MGWLLLGVPIEVELSDGLMSLVATVARNVLQWFQVLVTTYVLRSGHVLCGTVYKGRDSALVQLTLLRVDACSITCSIVECMLHQENLAALCF